MSFKEGVFYYVLYVVIGCVFAMILLFLYNILFIKEELTYSPKLAAVSTDL